MAFEYPDGKKVPKKGMFEESSFDPVKRIFKGTINTKKDERWPGSTPQAAKFEMTFSKNFKLMESKTVKYFNPDGKPAGSQSGGQPLKLYEGCVPC
jgi:hypothetical protein